MRNISHSLSTHTSTPRKAREFQLKARRIMQRMKKEEILMHNTRAQYDIILQGSRYIGRRRKSGAQEKKAERKREENNTNESSVVDLKAKHRLHVLFFLIYMLCSRIRIQNVFPKFAAGPRLRCMLGGACVCACKLKRNFFSFIRVQKNSSYFWIDFRGDFQQEWKKSFIKFDGVFITQQQRRSLPYRWWRMSLQMCM